LREMIADPGRNLADFLDHAEIERPPPDEGPQRVEEMLAKAEDS
jgi:hypothetical protein